MMRILLTVVALAALPLGSRAGETVVRLNVRPMPAPKPALRYLLLPEVHEYKPGNAAQYYLRCFAEQRNFFFSKEGVGERARYLALPLDKLPADQLRNYGGHALTQADWAARLESLDWGVLERVQNEGLGMQLPEVGPLHVLATALRVRFRGDVAGHRYDDAARSAKTMLAFARHLGEYPAEAANQLGLTVAQLALDTLDEMVQQRDAPNLYWALTDLPCPLVDVRKGLQGDRTLVATELRPLRDDAAMTEEQIEKLVSRLSGVMGFAREQAGQPPRSLRTALAARVKDEEKVKAARRRLVEAGDVRLFFRNFPPAQFILLDAKRDYEARRDERMKLLGLAPWQIDELDCCTDAAQGEDSLFADLVPNVIAIRRAQARLDQRVGLLRCVEALRLYAAGHDGKLPAKLSDCPVPLPEDPFTGKPFAYKVEAGTAHLGSGEIQYVVTMRK
jgi:hypothetical protein